MSDTAAQVDKKIPKPILLIGTFQTATGLWLITSMAITNSWYLWTILFAVLYTALGGGLLAMMAWARFGSVVIHPMILLWLLFRASNGYAGLGTASQVLIVLIILYFLTRPEIRARF